MHRRKKLPRQKLGPPSTVKLPASQDAEHAGHAHDRPVHCYSTLQVCHALLTAADAHGVVSI
jgi:hypothetical protein